MPSVAWSVLELVGTVNVQDPGINPHYSSHTRDMKIGALVTAPPDDWNSGSVLEIVGPVPVYCDWVR